MEIFKCKMTWDIPRVAQNYENTINCGNQTKNTKGFTKKRKYNNPKETVRLICSVNQFIRQIRVIRDQLYMLELKEI